MHGPKMIFSSACTSRPAPTSPPHILLEHEIESLLYLAKQVDRRAYMMILLAVNTGLRNSELIGLDIEDVTPYGEITPILEVRAAIAKNHEPRSIPLRPLVRHELGLYVKSICNSESSSAGNLPLFRSLRGPRRLSPRDFQRLLHDLSVQALGRKIHPHMLRHTFATRLLRVSNLRIVQQILGHKNLQSTQIYTHPSSDDLADAVNKL